MDQRPRQIGVLKWRSALGAAGHSCSAKGAAVGALVVGLWASRCWRPGSGSDPWHGCGCCGCSGQCDGCRVVEGQSSIGENGVRLLVVYVVVNGLRVSMVKGSRVEWRGV